MDISREELVYSSFEGRVKVFKGRFGEGAVNLAIKEETHFSLKDCNDAIREAMNQASLMDEHICKVFKCSIEEQLPGELKSIIIMELMSRDLGVEMSSRKAENDLWTEDQLLEMLRDLTRALHYAEKEGVFHQDIKPQNLFLAADRRTVKIGDFGTSSKLVTRGDVWMSTIKGTPLFMSPELKKAFAEELVGKQSKLQYNPVKSDVYSLGLTVLALATLEMPVSFMSLQGLELTTQQAISGLEIYPRLQKCVSWMLEIDPNQRPSFADLNTFLMYIDVQETERQEWKTDMSDSGDTDRSDELWSTDDEYPRSKCVWCEKSIGNSWLYRSDIALQCGHAFHNKKCFLHYLTVLIADFQHIDNYHCPICQTEIDYQLLEQVIGSKTLMRTARKVMKACAYCDAVDAELTVMKCKHFICERCTLIDRHSDPCPKCSSIWCFR